MEQNLIDKRDNTTINRNKIQKKFIKAKIMKMEINLMLNQLKVKKSILQKMTHKKIQKTQNLKNLIRSLQI
jgi:hypothetical protein